MSTTSAVAHLKVLEERHSHDHDGGYALLADITDYAASLEAPNRDALRDKLMEYARDDTSDMYSVALQALVQGWGASVAPEMASWLGSESAARSDEWTGQLLFAVLRMGYEPIVPAALKYLQQRVRMMDDTVLPIIAALCLVSPQVGVQLAAQVFGGAAKGKVQRSLEGYLPAFVIAFLDNKPELLILLLREISEINESAGDYFACYIQDLLSQPWLVDSRNSTFLRSIQSEIASMRA